MIRVHRPNDVPRILRLRGQPRQQRLLEAYERGERELDFDRRIYADASVKQALIEMQHGKCCYCEFKPAPGHRGDVEHFRPKSAVQQAPGELLLRPGYYWLAYEWSNLLFSCAVCNREHKKNLFPLTNPGHRVRTHQDDLTAEEPLLINPAEEDPAEHIGFRQEYAFPIGNNVRGRVTIETLRLNHTALIERRRDMYKRMRAISNLPGGLEFLEAFTNDEAEYASMTRAAVAAGFTI